MPEQPGAGRLDPEILAAYIDGQLPPEERARVDAEIAADPETYEWVVNSINAVDDPTIVQAGEPQHGGAATPGPLPDTGPSPVPTGGSGGDGKVLPFFRRRTVQGVVGAVVAVAAGLVLVVRTQPVWWQGIWGPSADPRFVALVEAVGEERYIEARLTGGFKYGPLRQVMRGPDDLSSQNLKLLAAAGDLQKAAERNPNAENLHAWGVAQLLLGRPREAVVTLHRSVLGNGASADRWADLAAAYLATAAFDGAGQYPKALEAALAALELNPRHNQALFNKALALEAMGLKQNADEVWKTFLAVETDPGWRAEAIRVTSSRQMPKSERWPALRDGVAGGSVAAIRPQDFDLLQELRSHLVGLVLPRVLHEKNEHELALRFARAIQNATGDPYLVSVLEDIAARPASLRGELRAAIDTFAAALRPFEANQFAAASQPMSVARQSLARLKSPLAYLAELNWAACQYYLGKPEEAERSLTLLADLAHARDWSELEGRSHWLLGQVHASIGNLGAAETANRRAIEIFNGSHDLALVSRVEGALAAYQTYVGDSEQSWSARIASMRHTAGDQRNLYAQLSTGAESCVIDGCRRVALYFQREASVLASSMSPPSLSTEAFARLARLSSAFGREEEAIAQLDAAQRAMSSVADEALRRRYEAQFRMAEAEVLRSHDPRRALAAGSRALELASGNNDRLRVAQAQRWRAEAARAANDVDTAREALTAGIDAIWSEVESLPPSRQPSRLDAAWGLVQLGAADALDRQDAEAFLGWATTSSRRRERTPAERRPLVEIQRLLRPGEIFLSVMVVEDRIAWLVTSLESHRLLSEPVEVSKLTDTIAALRQKAKLRESIDAELTALNDLLVAPIALDIAAAKRLAILADGVLATVPFAALKDRVTGTYLVERSEVRTLTRPDLTTRASATVQQRTSIALVDAADARPGARLQAARREVEDVARLYESSQRLGEFGSRKGLPLAMASSDVIHVSSHAQVNERYPDLSRIVMQHPSDDIFAKEVRTWRLRPGAVVVLAACETAAGRVQHGEGLLSLAGAFIEAGASSVIATLWDVADEPARQLFVRVQRELAGGATSASALRASQLEAIRRKQLPIDWAAPIEMSSQF